MGKFLATNNPEISKREIEGSKKALKIASEAVVLLENKILPVEKARKVALFGNGVRHTVKGGTGSGSVNSRNVVNIEDGFKEEGIDIVTDSYLSKVDDVILKDKLSYKEWCEKRASECNTFPGIVAMCEGKKESIIPLVTEDDLKEADIAVYVLSRNSGEGCDRNEGKGDFCLYDEELLNIKTIAKKYEKFVVVLNIGGVMDVTPLKDLEGIGAIILLGQLGNITGKILPKVLWGEINPSGRLTDTWAKKYEDYPSSATFSHVNGNVDEEIYTEDIYVGYRYFDTFKIPVNYPFGYGLSYTDFEMEFVDAKIDGTIITAHVSVKNIGDRAGKEVVEGFIRAPKGRFDKPLHELCAFAKTSELKPNESETVTLIFDFKDLASFCAKCNAFVLHKGLYVFEIAKNSRDTKDACGFVLDEQKKTRIVKKLWEENPVLHTLSSANKLSSEEEVSMEIPEGLKTYKIDSSLIKTEEFTYTKEREELTTNIKEKVTFEMIKDGKASVSDLVAQLSVKELAYMAVGKHQIVEGKQDLVGNSSMGVPGAAGDSSDILLEDRGVESIVTADGPAGLRLQPIFKADLEGNYIPGGEVFEDTYMPLDESYDETNSKTYYQYCSAIPIAWQIASTWNEDLIKLAGDIVGTEMEEFGVDLWLAPGMNIHRNPLCGRNFEYYSEDPLVSGLCAAFITEGIHKHPGKSTTIKHYAGNNQEDNRFFVNDIVSERAFREIYLKGFEICVKKAKPYALMTSYNIVNGKHTSNSFELIQNVLRDEWGYDGLVMSDWCTTVDFPQQYYLYNSINSKSAPSGCMAAGNDLIMPGCEKDVKDIIDAVESGEELEGFSCSKADVQYAAMHIINTLLKTKNKTIYRNNK